MIWIWIALGFSLLYLLLQVYYVFAWHKIPSYAVPDDFIPIEGVTVIIVARNEEKSIGKCLRGILQQSFPPGLMEIIVVNDHSSDGTLDEVEKIKNDSIQLFSLQDFPDYIHAPAYKKSGITLGVEKAKFENIIITDADCEHPPHWLQSVLYHFQKNKAVFQTSPVLHQPGHTLLEKMQEMEQLVLMLITGAGLQSRLHDMANGANMAFTKIAFRYVNGFEGNFHYASGDDMFLVEKMRKPFPDKIKFVKSTDASVYTQAKKDWASLFRQRIRWAGKNEGLVNKTIKWIWLFIGTYHIFMIVAFLGALLQFFSAWPFIMLLCVKWTADYLMIATSAAFFQKTALLRYFVPLQFFYSYYILRLGLMILMGKKGDWVRD
jgi:glycosyltransferase involved in cell wall biosynthesis